MSSTETSRAPAGETYSTVMNQGICTSRLESLHRKNADARAAAGGAAAARPVPSGRGGAVAVRDPMEASYLLADGLGVHVVPVAPRSVLRDRGAHANKMMNRATLSSRIRLEAYFRSADNSHGGITGFIGPVHVSLDVTRSVAVRAELPAGNAYGSRAVPLDPSTPYYDSAAEHAAHAAHAAQAEWVTGLYM
ncbi:hypothetical protein DL767_006537 [Monosporascus sp. MG133]|nr:hypothetical protein DL767_006537 [Monosporascus sp. MG133]